MHALLHRQATLPHGYINSHISGLPCSLPNAGVTSVLPHRQRMLAQAVTSINGVLINKINLEHKGTFTVTGNQSGYAAKMKLHASGMLTSKSKLHEASFLLLKCLRREAEPTLTIIDARHGKQQA